MTVTAAPSVNNHVGNGVTTVFAYGFKILQAADLKVTVNGVIVTNYTVSGVRDPAGGSITFTPAPANGAAIRIARNMAIARGTDYQFNGALPADTLNDDQDSPVMMIQQVDEKVGRSLRAPDTDLPLNDLPAATSRANLLLGFDANGQPQAVSSVAGTATQLALDLANDTNVVLGDALIGVRRSDNLAQTLHAMVEAYTFLRGNQTPVTGTSGRVDLLRETNAVDPLASSAAIWPGGPVFAHAGFSKSFDNSEVVTGGNTPFVTLWSKAVNNGSNADVVAGLFETNVQQNNRTGFGANIIARSASGLTGHKLVGLEIDLQPAAGAPPTIAGGLYINAFTTAIPGPAIYIESIFGGEWGTGINIGKLSNTGSGLSPATGNPVMGTLVDTGTAQYQIAAVKFSNTHRVRFNGTATTHAEIFNDSGNFWRFKLGAGPLVLRDSADSISLASFNNQSSECVLNLETANAELRVAGTKVVTKRETGWTAMTGSSDKSTAYATGSVTLAQLAGRVMALQAALTTHGLIGT